MPYGFVFNGVAVVVLVVLVVAFLGVVAMSLPIIFDDKREGVVMTMMILTNHLLRMTILRILLRKVRISDVNGD